MSDYITNEESGNIFNIFNKYTDIPDDAINQMKMALSIDPAVAGAIMADGHPGYSVPIGGVVLLNDSISPAFIGYDIGCMMMMSILDIPVDDFMKYRELIAKELMASTNFGVGASYSGASRKEHRIMEDPLWLSSDVLIGQYDKAASQLGTSGSGNHFADLCIDSTGKHVALITHSGSRGAGHAVASHYSEMADIEQGRSDGYGWLDMNGAGFEYFEAMMLMCDYANACHEIIHRDFSNRIGAKIEDTFANKHNFAEVIHDIGVLHRKGATPARKGEFGIIPGSSGSYTYLTAGLGNEESLWSSPHGAGRVSSRSKAKKVFDRASFVRHMDDNDILYYGVASDETVKAYKDIDAVIETHNGVTLTPLMKLLPSVVVMGAK